MKVWLSLLLLFAAMVPAGQAADRAEAQKIEAMIASIEHLPGAVFIRNGSEYSGSQAAEHLRYKWQKADGRVKTAEDFIVLCASVSSTSGQKYRIRGADGHTVDAEIFFREQLRRLSSASDSATSESRP